MAQRNQIESYLSELLAPQTFSDYGPNGLQVEGKLEVRMLVSGVTASLALIDAAIERGADAILVHHEQALGRAPLVLAGDGRPLARIAWCTGGAQGYFEAAVAAGADVFLTGEVSEPQAHLARETGVAFLACGHHATERYGAPAVAARVAERFGLDHMFIDLPNPA